MFVDFSDMHSKMSSQKRLTTHSEYKKYMYECWWQCCLTNMRCPANQYHHDPLDEYDNCLSVIT